MQFETTEKIDFYLPKVKEFVEEVVLPVEAKIHGKEIPEKDSSLSEYKKLMLERIVELDEIGLPDDWDGVYTAQTK